MILPDLRSAWTGVRDFSAPASCPELWCRHSSLTPGFLRLSFCDTLDHGIRDLLAGRGDAFGTGDVSARHHLSLPAGLTLLDMPGIPNTSPSPCGPPGVCGKR